MWKAIAQEIINISRINSRVYIHVNAEITKMLHWCAVRFVLNDTHKYLSGSCAIDIQSSIHMLINIYNE